jgi:inorganic triphosphatase YgiF
MSPGRRERETTLAIVSEDPARVADEIAGLEEIAGFRLAPRRDERIHDVYFDTPERDLRARRLALRIRRVDARTSVALKGPERIEEGGATSRSELEGPPSEEFLERVAARLRRQDVAVSFASRGDVATTLRGAGLSPVQDRETHRRRRGVVPSREVASRPLAEMAVDAVVYRLADGPIRHHEIEIEAIGPSGVEAIGQVAAALRQRRDAALRPWPYGKLATGLALEELAREGVLTPGHAGVEGALDPETYRRVLERLVEREPQGFT